MIAKTTTGSSFNSALGYGAADLTPGQRQHKQTKVVLLDCYTLSSSEWRGMAAEMSAVAQGSRCQTPVWHTSLSVDASESLSGDQWRAAARQYCESMGADPQQHQVAIFQHRDRAHPHIHIYINRVRLDDGPALHTGHNFARNVKATRHIERSLALAPLPDRRTSLKDHSPAIQANRQMMATLVGEVLSQTKPSTFADLEADLAGQGVEMRVIPNTKGGYGISFKAGEHPAVKGSAIGYKYRHVQQQLDTNRAEYQTEIDQLKKDLDKAKNDPAKPVTTTKEVIKSNPKDTAEIKRLRQVEKDLIDQVEVNYDAWEKEKERADKVPETITKVITVPDPADKDTIDELTNTISEKNTEILKRKKKYNKLVEETNELIKKYNDLLIKGSGKQQTSPASAAAPITQAAGQAITLTSAADSLPLTPQQAHTVKLATASFEVKFKVAPTAQQVYKMLLGERVEMPQIGLKVWIVDNKWKSESIRQVATTSLAEETPGSIRTTPEARAIAPVSPTPPTAPPPIDQRWKPAYNQLVANREKDVAYNQWLTIAEKRLDETPTPETFHQVNRESGNVLILILMQKLGSYEKEKQAWQEDQDRKTSDRTELTPVAHQFFSSANKTKAILRLAYLDNPVDGQIISQLKESDSEWWASRQTYGSPKPAVTLRASDYQRGGPALPSYAEYASKRQLEEAKRLAKPTTREATPSQAVKQGPGHSR